MPAVMPMRTVSGRQVLPFAPDPGAIIIDDIAHALSMICRFGGHTSTFYSVAQHSVFVSIACHPDDALWGLLHDASEAYLCDVPRPIKHLPALEPYRLAEASLQAAIVGKFGLPVEQPDSVTAADERLLAAEFRDLLPILEHDHWRSRAAAWPQICPWSPDQARSQFLHRFEMLTAARVSDGPDGFR